MESPHPQHIVLTVIVIAAAVFLAIWGCPYLRLYNHQNLCIGLYVLLFLVFVYGRVDARRRRRAGNRTE